MSLAAALVGVLIGLLYIGDNALTRLLGSRVLVILGSASYALYLLQSPCREYLLQWLPPSAARLLALPISILASVMVWRFFEEPMRRYLLPQRRADARVREEKLAGYPIVN